MGDFLETLNTINNETSRWVRKSYCVICRYSDKASGDCRLLREVSIDVLNKLLSAPCNISKLINKSALKLAVPVSSYLGDKESLAEELTQEALLALVMKFKNKEFQFHGHNPSIVDILKFTSTVMKNYLSNMGTVKKVQGRYCVYFINGCTLNTYTVDYGNRMGKTESFPHYGSKECRKINPRLLKPSCGYFTSPKVDSLYSGTLGNNEFSVNNKFSLIDTIQCPVADVDQKVLEWSSLIKSIWLRAKSVPEIRCLVRLVKYQLLLEENQDVNNIVKIAAASRIDSSTVKKDFETLEKWRKKYDQRLD